MAIEPREGQSRYRLLETVRQYSQEKLLESGEAGEVRGRHLAWCLALVEEADPAPREGEQAAWLDRLDLDLDNLRAALDWATEVDVSSGLRIAAAMHDYWFGRAAYSEGRSRLGALLARSPERTALRARALLGAAWMACDQGDLAEATALAGELLEIAREVGDETLTIEALLVLGNTALFQGEVSRAYNILEEGVGLARASRPFALNWFAWAALSAGDILKAKEVLREGTSFSPPPTSERGRAMLLAWQGLLATLEGRRDQARACHEEQLDLFRRIHERRQVAQTLMRLADLALDEGDLARARALLDESVALGEEVGIATQPNTLLLLGRLALAENDLPQARISLEDSLAGIRGAGLGLLLPSVLCGLADLALAEGNAAAATAYLRECLTGYREGGHALGVYGALASLAMVAESSGDRAGGVRLLAVVLDRCPLDIFDSPGLRRRAEGLLASARSALGAEAFARAYADGQAMTLGQALDYALADTR